MIQRIQSMFLFDAALFVALMFFFPPFYIRFSEGEIPFGFLPSQMPPDAGSTIYVFATLAGLSIIISLFTIFQFKNRQLQIKLAWLNFLMCIAFLALVFMLPIGPKEENGIAFNWSAFMPAPAAIMQVLAIRFIKRDDNLVKSADRLR